MRGRSRRSWCASGSSVGSSAPPGSRSTIATTSGSEARARAGHGPVGPDGEGGAGAARGRGRHRRPQGRQRRRSLAPRRRRRARQEPGRARRAPARRARPRARRSSLVGSRARVPAARRRARRRHGHERQDEDEPGELVVCELSSFQLEDVDELRCRVAILVNLEPDHLDRHGSFEAYRAAKLRIFERCDVAVVPRGFAAVPGRRVEFAWDDTLPAEPRIPGRHNRENAAAATAAARALGVPDEQIALALDSFRGVPHRLELVGEKRGVRFVNDSKATNVAAALRALEAYESQPVHLILGGSRKGEDFAALAAAIGPNVRDVFLIGETADELAAALSGPFHRVTTLETAVPEAYAAAAAGDVVLLSPACASFDQFRDFEHRGEEFRRLAANLEE